MNVIPLIGYSDALSVVPGKTIRFMVSSNAAEPFEAHLVRVACADSNPHGPGYREEELSASLNGSYPSEWQPTYLGSYAVSDRAVRLAGPGLRAEAIIWPTLPHGHRQSIVSHWDAEAGAGFTLFLDNDGRLAFTLSDGSSETTAVLLARVRTRAWYAVAGGYDPARRLVWVSARALRPEIDEIEGWRSEVAASAAGPGNAERPIVVAARQTGKAEGPAAFHEHFNGKIEAPGVYALDAAGKETVLLAWDFSREISTVRVIDTGPGKLDGHLVNLPARAMTGSTWTGAVMRWSDAPDQYGAIHFHDDDLYDCGWKPSLSWQVPADFKSGLYALRLRAGGHEDHIPFVVRPALGKPTAKTLFVLSTFTYMAYCNFATPSFSVRSRQKVHEWGAYPYLPHDHREFGLSTYDLHTDGSGCCHSSRLRPNLNMRPRFIAAEDPKESGLRHYAADTYITAWLEHLGEDFDVVTDEDLHNDGAALLAPYRCVLTGTHPEYHTPQTLDAYQGYLAGGGRLMYLGGNGFYWKIAPHQTLPGVIELRRAEGGIRLWAAEPGEYYNAFDGSYGGLWRRNGRPPNLLAGVGFSAQGNYEGSYYIRQPGSHDPRVRFIFKGIGEEEVLGDFGFFGGGAAGFELDRADFTLGTPAHTLILASSGEHGEMYKQVNEELLRQFSHRPASEVLRSDIVFFETPSGGAVFSVGSITYCGSLPYNGYDNNIARLTANGLQRFLDEKPFPAPAEA